MPMYGREVRSAMEFAHDRLREIPKLSEIAVPSPNLLVGLGAFAIALVSAASASAQFSKESAAQLEQNPNQHVIVILKSQHAPVHKDSSELAQRSAAIDADQAPLMDELRLAHATNIKNYHLISALAATVSSAELDRLKANPAVRAVLPDDVIHPRPRQQAAYISQPANSAEPKTSSKLSLNLIPGACGSNGAVLLEPEGLALTYTDSDDPGAPTARSLGITGKGVKVAIIADGLDPNNVNFLRPDGTSVFVDYQDFSGDGPGQPTGGGEAFLDANTIAGQGIHVYDVSNYSVQPDPSPCNLRIEGVAPGASLVELNGFGLLEINSTSGLLQALDYAVQVDHVDVVNESFGGNNFPNITAMDVFSQFNDAAVAAGVVVSTGSGDSGSTNTVGWDDPLMIEAGASTDFRSYAQTNAGGARYFATTGWLSDNISALSSGGFSQTGATLDLIAPGDLSFTSCDADPAFSECTDYRGMASDVKLNGGTSESAPYVSGAAALVIEAYRKTHSGASPTPALVKQILVGTATDLAVPATEQGAGLLNSFAAVLLAESIQTTDGSPQRVGNTLLVSASQLNAVGAPGSPAAWQLTVTNTGSSPQAVNLAGRALGPNQNVQSGSVVLSDAKSRHFLSWGGAEENYEVINFQVPEGAPRLDASIAYPQTNPSGATVHLTLVDPQGRLAAYSLPQGIGNFGNVDVRFPAPGTWTGIISGVEADSSGVNGTIPWQAETEQFLPFASVSPGFLALAPGESQTVTVSTKLPSSPGDLAGSIVLTSDLGQGGSTSIPVTLRSLIDVPGGGAFNGVLTGGNGRAGGIGEEQSYQFDVPHGVGDITANVSLTNDAGDAVGAYLISPDGDTLGYGQNSVNGNNGLSLTAYTLNPVSGRWTLIVDFAGPIVGDEVSQLFTGNIQFNHVSVSAPQLPNSPRTRLAAVFPVTVPVTITNNGAAPEAFFIDPRLDATSSLTLVTQIGSSDTGLLLPLGVTPPFWLVPTETSSISVSQSSTLPAMFDMFLATGDPDIIPSAKTGSLCSTATSASFTPVGGTVGAGLWAAVPSECGPYDAPAPAATATLAMSALSKAFDLTITSDTDDFWLTSINPAATFSPIILGPGQTGTINVTITPTGASGTVVRGSLYIDDYVGAVPPYLTTSGDELAVIPYAYTVK